MDAKHQISLLRRRSRYQQKKDRPKVWPGAAVPCRWDYRQPEAVIDHWLAELVTPSSIASYISAWCHLNHLKAA